MALTDVPNPGQTLANSQGQIKNNFLAINSAFAVDHIGYNDSGQGKHSRLTMPVQGTIPNTTATELALFVKTSAYGVTPELSLRRQSNGSNYEFTSRGASVTNGWTILPSGIVFKWGTATANASGLTPVLFPVSVSIPVFTAAYNVQITQYSNTGLLGDNALGVTSTSSASFTVNNTNSSSVGFRWFAIGVI